MEANIVKLQAGRQLSEKNAVSAQRCLHVTESFANRLGLEKELMGHQGCVNCLEWNESGTLLASGSDDTKIIVWDPFGYRELCSLDSGHEGNIFSIKFLPNSNDGTIISGAADTKVRIHNVTNKETTHVFSCHSGRVKRLAVAGNVPFMFWSAAEDGTVMQFDLRQPHQCDSVCNTVLINLNAHVGSSAEVKCIAINPTQPEQLAIGANDPYIRLYDRRMLKTRPIKLPELHHGVRSPWERHNHLANISMDRDEFSLPDGCVTYFVAGHLPIKQQEFRRRARTLAATYVTFSPSGAELLANLGGEQIYLFDINRRRPPTNFDLPVKATSDVFKECSQTNGYRNGTTNGVCLPSNGVSRHIATTMAFIDSQDKSKSSKRPCSKLPAKADLLKQQANSVFDKHDYSLSISLYNQALQCAPEGAVLYANRAAAYMKRVWDGDLYAALRDCATALKLDANHIKAHFRLARCLFELKWTSEALDCLQVFKSKFPDYATSHACEALDRDIRAAIFSKTDQDDRDGKDSSKSPSGNSSRSQRKQFISDQEKVWRERACDYEQRFYGHCNTTTDIKEANFFGSKGQFVLAGSDDGSFFIWDRQSTNIVRVLRGDDSIVNCLQPHPSYCLLATSGIDPVVRLWSPRPEDGAKNEREIANSHDAARDNQKRMNADPLEVMLMNMGYRITSMDDGEDAGDRHEGTVQCHPS